MINNAEHGDIVWIASGYGPKAMVLERLDRRTNKERRHSRGIYYKVVILEERGTWIKEETAELRAMSLSRVKRP